MPRSAIISTTSRKLSLNLRYQRTHRMMISRSKWRPLKRSSMLSIPVCVLKSRLSAEYAPLQAFAPEPAILQFIRFFAPLRKAGDTAPLWTLKLLIDRPHQAPAIGEQGTREPRSLPPLGPEAKTECQLGLPVSHRSTENLLVAPE